MSDWKHRAAVEIANEYAVIHETGEISQTEIEALVADAIARHVPPSVKEWLTIESAESDQLVDLRKVGCLELVDLRNEPEALGRSFVATDVSIKMSIQDQGRTMKLLIAEPTRNA
ncbi:MAG: hypothetical protein ACR2PI_18130 [Hyphomicrobiaceae bacterium]